MASLLKYRSNHIETINPKNGVNFVSDEVIDLIKCRELSYYHVKSHFNNPSGFVLAFDASNINNIAQFNLLATREHLKGSFAIEDYTLMCTKMRINPVEFFEENKHINFISGLALFGRVKEFKEYQYTDPIKHKF